jgi:hypothetical protein
MPQITKLDKRHSGYQDWYCYVFSRSLRGSGLAAMAAFWEWLKFCQENFGLGIERDMLYAVKDRETEPSSFLNTAGTQCVNVS